MMNTLLCAYDDGIEQLRLRRLFVACDDARQLPPRRSFVEARRVDGAQRRRTRPRRIRRTATIRSHWPAAVGYALWQIESPPSATAMAAQS
jgi:hypothetical protein